MGVSDFENFKAKLCSATERIGPAYFDVKFAGSEKIVYRERVYCYELYHQLRCCFNTTGYVLHGEMDKSSHQILHSLIGAKKPDFIVHCPGSMSSNLVVMEVKTVRNLTKLGKDLANLRKLVEEAKYQFGIMLIYGGENPSIKEKIALAKQSLDKYDNIFLFWHKQAGEPAEQL